MKSLAMTSPEPTVSHRFVALTSWALPGTVLALLPKCPACFAAYAALWTGIALSMPVASGLRLALLTVSVASLAFLAFFKVRRACRAVRNGCAQGVVPITGTSGTAETTGAAGKSVTCTHY